LPARDRAAEDRDGDLEQQDYAQQHRHHTLHRPRSVELGQIVRIDQHQHEQEQHQNRAGVDDHLDDREELRAHHDEDAGDVDEADAKEDSGMDRVGRRNHAACRDDTDRRQQGERQKVPGHQLAPCRMVRWMLPALRNFWIRPSMREHV
jgi:hypothetical protein